MRTLFYILILLLVLGCKTSKEIATTTDFCLQRPGIHEIDSIEKRSHGVRLYPSYKITVSQDYFPNSEKFNLGQPFVYTRDYSTVKSQVTYYFSIPDSIVRLVEYNWNAAGNGHNTISQLFSTNKLLLSKYFKNEGAGSERIEEAWSRKDIVWENDSTFVKQFMLIQGQPTRTRVLISWK